MNKERSILVVDDEAVILKMVERVLNRFGYSVWGSNTCDEAVKAVKERRFDLVLLDMLMPGTNGFDLLRTIQSIAPSTPVVVMSGYASPEVASDTSKAGANGFLAKPFTPEELQIGLSAVVNIQ